MTSVDTSQASRDGQPRCAQAAPVHTDGHAGCKRNVADGMTRPVSSDQLSTREPLAAAARAARGTPTVAYSPRLRIAVSSKQNVRRGSAPVATPEVENVGLERTVPLAGDTTQ